MKSLAIISLLLFSYSTLSYSDDNLQIKDLLKTNYVVIIDEKFERPETIDFVSYVIKEFVKNGDCLKVMLELPSDQQN